MRLNLNAIFISKPAAFGEMVCESTEELKRELIFVMRTDDELKKAVNKKIKKIKTKAIFESLNFDVQEAVSGFIQMMDDDKKQRTEEEKEKQEKLEQQARKDKYHTDIEKITQKIIDNEKIQEKIEQHIYALLQNSNTQKQEALNKENLLNHRIMDVVSYYTNFQKDLPILLEKGFVTNNGDTLHLEKTKKFLSEYFGYQKTPAKWAVVEILFDEKDLKNSFSIKETTTGKKSYSKDYKDWLEIKNTPNS